MEHAEIVLTAPEWLAGYLAEAGEVFAEVEARMALVVALARMNVRQQTGGPFGAAVFERDGGRLVAAGVNRVTAVNCSAAHAEIMALAAAQQAVGHYDLGTEGMAAHELVSSTAPCAMCLGAIAWSGVRRLVCGAREEDARAIGFDEGDKPADWRGGLQRRGIEVVEDVLRDEAAAVLQQYRRDGGEIYNSGQR